MKITIELRSVLVTLEVAEWIVWAATAGVVIGLLVAANVAVNPHVTLSGVKAAIWIGVTFWLLVAVFIFASCGFGEDFRMDMPIRLRRKTK